jgi:RHS repeat-associated protein
MWIRHPDASNTIAASSNRLVQVQDVTGTVGFQYDNAGNVTSDGISTYAYSDRGRMSGATTPSGPVALLYNALEQRTQKSGPNGASYYVYDEAGKLLGEYDANGGPVYETIYLGIPVGVMKQSGSAGASNLTTSLYNVSTDQLGAPRIITRSSDEAIVWRWDTAEAFGATAPDQDPSNLGAFTFNQRFPGQVFDQESGLNQNWHREYDPRGGRYRQSDPIGLRGGINTFAYVGGDPLRLSDPEGLNPGVGCLAGAWAGPVGCGVGAGIGTVATVVGMALAVGSLPGDTRKTPRPGDMTREEERQFDRHCANSGDPCAELKKAANDAIDGARQKLNNMLTDKDGLFGGIGWKTHRADLSGRISSIMAMISVGKKMGCDMASEEAKAATLFLPLVPRWVMKISIDASMFVGSDTAYGRLSGYLNVAAIPMQGALISFLFPLIGAQCSPPSFSGQLRVASVIFRPSLEEEAEVIVMLEDIVFDSLTDAKEVAEYMAEGFHLFVEEYS